LSPRCGRCARFYHFSQPHQRRVLLYIVASTGDCGRDIVIGSREIPAARMA
jgi:hypothetical protein